MGRWQEIDHTADLAVHIWARDLPDLFATAAKAMFSLIADLDSMLVTSSATIRLQALDVETLLVDWLNELLFLNETQGLAFTAFTFLRLDTTHIECVVEGGEFATYLNYVKAATFHNLEVRQTVHGYETEIVFDT